MCRSGMPRVRAARWLRGPAGSRHVPCLQALLPDTPAAEVGLRAGDIITSIDGKAAAEFSLDQLNQLFKLRDRVFQLTIKRGEQETQVRLRTKRLI